MSDDWEYNELECPRCHAYPTRARRCGEIGCDDGWIDMHECDDPMLFDKGDMEMYQECHGTGWLRWCGECGYELPAANIRAQETEPTP